MWKATRGLFDIQSPDKFRRQTGFNIRTHAHPKLDRTGVRRCQRPLLASRTRHKCSMETSQYLAMKSRSVRLILVSRSRVGVMSYQWRVSLHMVILKNAMYHLGEGLSYCSIRSLNRQLNFLRDNWKRSLTHPLPRSLYENQAALRINKTFIRGASPGILYDIVYRIINEKYVIDVSIYEVELRCWLFQNTFVSYEYTVDGFMFVGTNFRGVNKNNTFVGFKNCGHSILFNNSYRKFNFVDTRIRGLDPPKNPRKLVPREI